jgi:hypothetical protein
VSDSFALGQVARITATFTNSDGDAADPANVFCQIKNPAGTITSYQHGVDGEVVKSATGIYYLEQDCDTAGWWAWRWYSTVTVQAAIEGRILVQESEFD